MSILAIDLIDNLDGELGGDGYKFTRTAIVQNPVMDPGDNPPLYPSAATRIYEAIHDSEMPKIGDPHPAISSVILTNIRAVAVDTKTVTLELTYNTPRWTHYKWKANDPAQVSCENSLIQTETSKQLFTNTYLTPVSYTYKAGTVCPWKPTKTDDEGEEVENLLLEDVTIQSELPLVPAYIPSRIYTVRKIVKGLSMADLELINHTFQGRVNAGGWRGYNPRTWLCVGITWFSTDLSGEYEVTLQFQYKPDTYDVTVMYICPWTGKAPSDVTNLSTQPDAIKTYQVLPTANFSLLSTYIDDPALG